MRRSAGVLFAFGLLLISCSPSPEFFRETFIPEELIFEHALSLVQHETHLTFDTSPIMQTVENGVSARTYLSQSDRVGVTINHLGENRVTWEILEAIDIDEPMVLHPAAGCWLCTQWVRHGGYYKETWVSRTVTTFVSASSAAACYALGGGWMGAGVCAVVTTELVRALTWVRPWRECVKWVWERNCPVAITPWNIQIDRLVVSLGKIAQLKASC